MKQLTCTTVTNYEQDVEDKIIADLTEGTKLPLNMDQIGRWNKTVCTGNACKGYDADEP